MDRREFLTFGGATLAAVLAAEPAIAASRIPATERAKTASRIPTTVAPATKPAWFDVRTYGALGDGTTDDTTAIRAAIEAARKSGGGIVLIPAGTYLTSTLTLYGEITLQGTGWQSVLKLKDGANAHLVTTPRTGTNHYGVVRDLALDGNRIANASGDGLNLFAASNYRIESVKITEFAGHAISLDGASNQPTIAPWILNCCIFKCTKNGIHVAGNVSDCKIHAVDIGWCDKGLILPHASFLTDVTIWQCNTGLYGYWAANSHLHMVRVERCNYNGFLFEGCTDLSVEQCRAYENNQANAYCDGFAFRGAADHPCVRLNVTGCMSGLTGSAFEKQRYGFSDGESSYVDYLLCNNCTALGNTYAGYSLAAGANNQIGSNM